MATAVTAGAAATGLRAWLRAAAPAWLTPLRLRRISAGLIASAVLASGVTVG